jgi:hypothetical protein
MTRLRILAIASSHHRVGYVFLIDKDLKDWHLSKKAARSKLEAVGEVQGWINTLKPDVVVSEKVAGSRKSEHTREIMAAIAHLASQNYVLDITVERKQLYANKYDEAEALVHLYPELKPWLPRKRKFYDKEPRNIVLFEALALALVVLKRPTTTLAAGMG